ncbi:MAG: NAD(P)H-dependent oxidoreductase [Sphingomonadales bacterium]|nr:NAD(P)H-dependent oxidoreductase [Sphingomonadales bacterium]
MPRNIAVILGHPDPAGTTYCAALAERYARAAEKAGHAVKLIDVAKLDFPILRSAAEFAAPATSPDIKAAQATIAWADHLVFVYPLWLGALPALLKAFLEQICRGGFAVAPEAGGMKWAQKLKGKSARIVVTMGMPAVAYRWFFRAHSLKSFERNILRFAGIGPVRDTIIGMVERSPDHRRRWLERVAALGRKGA